MMSEDLEKWTSYHSACEELDRRIREHAFYRGDDPKVIYATADLFSLLSCGPALIVHADGSHTFRGIPVQFCSGSGPAFHFADDIFKIGDGRAET